MLSLTLIFRNFHLAARVRIGGGRFLNQLRSPQSSSDSPLEQAGSNRQYRVRRPRFRERGSCRLCLPQRRRRRDETRYHDDGGGLPRDRWFESGFLQRRVACEPEDDVGIPVPRGNSPQIGGPAVSGNASLNDPGVVGAGSFPRSFLIPRTDTSIAAA